MNQRDICQAKDPDLQASLQAMLRAAEEARRVAISTGTDLIVSEDAQVVRLSAHCLGLPPQAAGQRCTTR